MSEKNKFYCWKLKLRLDSSCSSTWKDAREFVPFETRSCNRRVEGFQICSDSGISFAPTQCLTMSFVCGKRSFWPIAGEVVVVVNIYSSSILFPWSVCLVFVVDRMFTWDHVENKRPCLTVSSDFLHQKQPVVN